MSLLPDEPGRVRAPSSSPTKRPSGEVAEGRTVRSMSTRLAALHHDAPNWWPPLVVAIALAGASAAGAVWPSYAVAAAAPTQLVSSVSAGPSLPVTPGPPSAAAADKGHRDTDGASQFEQALI